VRHHAQHAIEPLGPHPDAQALAHMQRLFFQVNPQRTVGSQRHHIKIKDLAEAKAAMCL